MRLVAVMEAVDVLAKGCTQVDHRFVGAKPKPLPLERREERLRHRIVITVADPTHDWRISSEAHTLEPARGILNLLFSSKRSIVT